MRDILENLAKNKHLIALPSSLWGVHVHPDLNYIAICCLKMKNCSLKIEKSILMKVEENCVKTSIFVENQAICDPKFDLNIETITDLSNLLRDLHEIRICENFEKSSEFPKCSKYFESSSHNYDINYCLNCLENLEFVENARNSDFESSNEAENETTFLGPQSNKTASKSIENNQNSFQCTTCSKLFRKKYNLKVHERTHSGEKPYICSKCGKTFSTRSNLSTHLMSVHAEKKRHLCRFCGMTFVHPRQLRIHMRKHTGEKPFMCSICGKVFAKNIHLTIHTRTHTGEKPHVCNLCGKGFTTTGNLQSHKKIHHKNIPS